MSSYAKSSYPEKLQKQLQQALKNQEINYQPRTKLLLPDGSPKYTNRLILEDSPYLIQHAHNPVDWYAWGDAVFAKAETKDKPIFLSIGYSSCHWCHVMEQESFDNEKIAEYLNAHFICIKVDREQRPDVDAYYMAGVMLITGQGGWPMSNFLLADGGPFFGGTYYSPTHFRQILEQINLAWQSRRNELIISADQINTAIIKINSSKSNSQKLDHKVIKSAIKAIMQGYDEEQGGFGAAPKFPNESYLFLLLRQLTRKNDSSLTHALNHTLDAMAAGGIYDQIGGGFHRYATDNNWLVPHFEKMLYNQAHLANIYLQAYLLSGNSNYRRVVQQTLDYLLDEMQSPEGGFYSATDADSEGEEGRFFVWKQEQIISALPADLSDLAIDLFRVSKQGNFVGLNILHLPITLDKYARENKIALTKLYSQLDKIRKFLWKVRNKRIPPARDDKILISWNSMVIGILAQAGKSLNYPKYLEEAKRAAEFLWHNNTVDLGKLYRVNFNGKISIMAMQEDYAYFAEALLILYDTTHDENWLQKARKITDVMLQEFWDTERGGFFMAKQSKIPPKMYSLKEASDGVIPSGNSIAIHVLDKMTKRSGERFYQDKAWDTVAAFATQIIENPASHAYLLLGVEQLLDGEIDSTQYAALGMVVISGKLEYEQANNYRLTIDLRLKNGWHVNAHQPWQKDLIATEITLDNQNKNWQLQEIIYPEPIQKKLKSGQDVLALYEDTVQVRAKVIKNNNSNMLLPIKVTLQACNDTYCLAPEFLLLHIFASK